MRFMAFWESTDSRNYNEVATTIDYIDTDDLLERLRRRLELVEPGTSVRIDLLASDETE